ncbi:MAG: hypothetical protein JO100_17825 [Pseudonocardia sp.]|nr:hypothetical protein [Pseudonocardia sp.]
MSSEVTWGCGRQSEAGAYLLGALNPAERSDYAQHLTRCLPCLREIGQLAGLPGLLARRTPQVMSSTEPAWHATGNGAVAAALTQIRRERARRRVLVVGALVLVAFVGAGGALAWDTTMARTTTGVVAAADLPVAMQPVGAVPVSAAVQLTPRPWGTEVVMRCRYDSATGRRTPVYTLVAIATDNSAHELARWSAVVGQDVVLATSTELAMPQLAGLEVRNGLGAVVLRTDHV